LLAWLGGRARFVPTREDFHLDVAAIGAAVNRRTKGLILCTPNNPTGAVYTREELAEVLALAERHSLVVISDESYSRITYDGRPHCSIASLPGGIERTVVVNGLSKVYAMTGWRLGYVIARADLVPQLEKVAYEIRGPVNTAVQHAGAAALRTNDRTVASIVRRYDRKRRLMVSGLRAAGLSCHMPEGGFEALPRTPPGYRTGSEFAEHLVETTGVLVKPGRYFGPDGTNHVRIVYCREEPDIRLAIGRLRRALRSGFDTPPARRSRGGAQS
jgi:aminotransferase